MTHSVKELEKKGLAILLPFYVLKLRKQVEKAKSGTERKKLSGEMQILLDELTEAVQNCERKGKIGNVDIPDILDGLERLFQELYGKYEEFMEDDIMLQEKLDTYLESVYKVKRALEKEVAMQL